MQRHGAVCCFDERRCSSCGSNGFEGWRSPDSRADGKPDHRYCLAGGRSSQRTKGSCTGGVPGTGAQ